MYVWYMCVCMPRGGVGLRKEICIWKSEDNLWYGSSEAKHNIFFLSFLKGFELASRPNRMASNSQSLPVSASPVPGSLAYTTKTGFFMWVLVIDGHSWSNRDGDISAQRTILYGAGGLEETKVSAFTFLKPCLWVQIVLFNYSIAAGSGKFLIHLWGTTRQCLFFFINGIKPNKTLTRLPRCLSDPEGMLPFFPFISNQLSDYFYHPVHMLRMS